MEDLDPGAFQCRRPAAEVLRVVLDAGLRSARRLVRGAHLDRGQHHEGLLGACGVLRDRFDDAIRPVGVLRQRHEVRGDLPAS